VRLARYSAGVSARCGLAPAQRLALDPAASPDHPLRPSAAVRAADNTADDLSFWLAARAPETRGWRAK
jgi:hypothetical protein